MPVTRHGVVTHGSGQAFVCGIALWPYDLLLRFGYDLPENEHLWEGEWFDDAYERAALDMRADAAKLLLARRAMDAAVVGLRQAVEESHAAAAGAESLKALVLEAPLALDAVLSYLRRLVDGVGVIIPCCYGEAGKVLAADRWQVDGLARSEALMGLDAGLATILAGRPDLAIQTNQADLYVIANSGGFSAALPKSAARALRASAAVTLDAVAAVDEAMEATFRWFDVVLAQLQAAVAARAEDGPDLLARWSDENWAVVATMDAPPEA